MFTLLRRFRRWLSPSPARCACNRPSPEEAAKIAAAVRVEMRRVFDELEANGVAELRPR